MKHAFLTFILIAGILTAFPALADSAPRDTTQEEANRELVIEFYDRFFNQHDISAASELITEDYIQHNPQVPDGRAPLVSYFSGFFSENPESRARIVRSAADGDLVWLHIESTNGDKAPAQAVIDIFRVKGGQIVEHWDVIQNIPQETANDNTMF
ncbi:MAG: nuclear transport factor 2 family protein [Paracoccus sp. (in: a-proteobacteria)]